jgi:hypothetical protein
MKQRFLSSEDTELPFSDENTKKTLKREIEPIWCTKNKNFDINILKSILEERYQERQRALNDLMLIGYFKHKDANDFINNFYGYFHVNTNCLCNDLFNIKDDTIFKVGKLLASGKAGTAYFLDIKEEYPLIIKGMKIDTIKQYLSVYLFIPTEEDKIMNPSNYLNSWKNQKGTEKIITVGGDNFSNQTCLHLILNTILKDNQNYVYQYDAFYCKKGNQNYGYNIMETANGGNLFNFLNENKINDYVLSDMLKQIFEPISILKKSKYSFNHSDLKPNNVFVKIENNRPIFKIADFDKSSITWNTVRFYNNSFPLLSYDNYISYIKNTKFKINSLNQNGETIYYYIFYVLLLCISLF